MNLSSTESEDKESGYLGSCGRSATSIKDIHAGMLNSELCVRGTITRCGSLLTAVTQMPYQCQRCKHENVLLVKENTVTLKGPPCEKCKWKKTTCKLQRAVTLDMQKIVIQEAESIFGHFLTLSVQGELCLQHAIGQTVSATGILRTMKPGFTSLGGVRKCDSVLRSMYLEVHSLCDYGRQEVCPIPDACVRLNNANRYLTLESIVHSLSGVKGLHYAKCALALSLFSGGKEECRSNSHVLLIGDPGLGKSTLLKDVSCIPTVAYYVCGSGNTTVGLTASMTDCGSDCILDPGALVLSHGGVCCVDELDKMTSKHGALLECMEQQTVTVAKNGLVCSLPADCAVIAAGNPVGGHYDQNKSVQQNVNISAAILSRFDLVLGLLDEPVPGRERELAAFIMRKTEGNCIEGRKSEDPALKYFFKEGYQTQASKDRTAPCDDATNISSEPTLHDRLKSDCWDRIPKQVIRDYLAFARAKYPTVKLSKNAKEAIKRYFLNTKHFGGRIPLTTRQLAGIVRLTKARARIELRSSATLNDACDAIELFDLSWFGLNIDVGTPSIDEFQPIPGISQGKQEKVRNTSRKSQIHNFLTAAKEEGKTVSKERLKDLFEDHISWNVFFEDFLKSLNEEGFIISQGLGQYKVLS